MLVHIGHLAAIVFVAAGGNGMVDFGRLEDAIEQAGRAIAEILGAAHEHNADLIIMGNRGLGQIGGPVLGSVSEQVLCGARVPVLIVR
jgi:nucleotide-binding universal stress UspA family protein